MPHRYTPVQFHRYKQEHILNHYCTVAPLSHNHAICIEYVKKWFLEKFPKDFFSYFFVDGSNVFGETIRLPKDKVIVKGSDDTCTCTMSCQLDDTYDRSMIDTNLFGLEMFVNTTPIDRSFIQDPVNHRYVMMKMEMERKMKKWCFQNVWRIAITPIISPETTATKVILKKSISVILKFKIR